jgi:hypothetical protein
MTYATVVRRPAAACFGSRSFGQRPHIPGRSAQPPPRRSSAAKEGRPQAAAAWRQRRQCRLQAVWHAACVLEIDPTTIDADHVGLYAATMLSRSDAANVV